MELIDDNTKKRLSKKCKKLEDSLRLKHAQSVAPGQEEEFFAQVLSISTNDQDNEKYQTTFSTICNCIRKVMLLEKW